MCKIEIPEDEVDLGGSWSKEYEREGRDSAVPSLGRLLAKFAHHPKADALGIPANFSKPMTKAFWRRERRPQSSTPMTAAAVICVRSEVYAVGEFLLADKSDNGCSYEDRGGRLNGQDYVLMVVGDSAARFDGRLLTNFTHIISARADARASKRNS